MLTLKKPRLARTRFSKPVSPPPPQTRDLPNVDLEERRFKRWLEWGAVGVSVFLILATFYLLSGTVWGVGIAS